MGMEPGHAAAVRGGVKYVKEKRVGFYPSLYKGLGGCSIKTGERPDRNPTKEANKIKRVRPPGTFNNKHKEYLTP